MSDDAPKKPAATGVPAWVMTFADLMTLLMCFFVLLLSFSSMDVAKYKELAGSMKDAFGVQRDVDIREMPKGVNVVAREFSAGRPDPTPLNVVQQQTTDEMRQFLDTGGDSAKAGRKGKSTGGLNTDAGSAGDEGQQLEAGDEGKTASPDKADAAAAAAKAGEAEKLGAAEKEGKQAKADQAFKDQLVMMPMDDAMQALKAKQAVKQDQALQKSADEIRAALEDEIKSGAVDVETEYQKIVIRIREKTSFGSGAADLRMSFRPILDNVGKVLKETEGRIIVSGHTDDVPIATDRYRSNWELSAGRAVSVVHELIFVSHIPSERFTVEGLAETRPIVANDSVENRSRNRRVEIKLLQGADLEAHGDIGGTPAVPEPAPAKITLPKPAPAKPAPVKEDPFVRS